MQTTNDTLVPVETTLAQIRPGPFQHRQAFDRERLAGLAQSIRANGLVNPPIVFAENGHYCLISGERRWRALCALALTGMEAEKATELVCQPNAPRQLLEQWSHVLGQTPVTIRLAPGGDPQTWHVLAVIDNAQHESLNPIEEARDYLSLQQQYSWTDRRVARTVGVSEARVKARLRWLDLADPIQELVAQGSLPRDGRVAEALLDIPDPVARLRMARYHSERNSSIQTIVTSCQRLAEKLDRSEPGPRPSAPPLLALAGQPPARHGSLPPGSLRQAARQMCGNCPMKENERLARVPEPAWTIVAAEATGVCHQCPLHEVRQVCGNCPGAALLKNIIANYTEEQP